MTELLLFIVIDRCKRQPVWREAASKCDIPEKTKRNDYLLALIRDPLPLCHAGEQVNRKWPARHISDLSQQIRTQIKRTLVRF